MSEELEKIKQAVREVLIENAGEKMDLEDVMAALEARDIDTSGISSVVLRTLMKLADEDPTIEQRIHFKYIYKALH